MNTNHHLSSFYMPILKFLVLAILLSSAIWGQAQTYTTISNGNWIESSIWNTTNFPPYSGGLSNNSQIYVDHNVHLESQTFSSGNQSNNLQIHVGKNSPATLVVDYNFLISKTVNIVIYANSTLQIGNSPGTNYDYCTDTLNTNSLFHIDDSNKDPSLTVKDGGTFHLYGDFKVENKFNITIETGGEFNVEGSFTAGNSADVTFAGAGGYVGCDMNFDNGAVINLDVGSLYVGGDLLFGNSADIYMSASEIEVMGGICSYQGQGSGAVVQLHGDTLNPSTISAGYICEDVDIAPVDGITIEDISTLPIELLHFEAVATEYTVEINWSTATEINNNFFTIERSPDMITWEITGVVAGAGTTSAVQNYLYTDQSPVKGLTYYRLKQTDFDGSFEYFAPEAVVFDPTSEGIDFKVLKAFESWYVSLPGETEFIVEVFDLAGRRLYSGNGVNNISIPAQGHPVVMRVVRGNSQVISRIVM